MCRPIHWGRVRSIGSITWRRSFRVLLRLTTAAFIPQAYKIIHTRETKGVSLWMHITFAIGVAFWFILGIMLWNWPMMAANAVTFILTVVILIMKIHYG